MNRVWDLARRTVLDQFEAHIAVWSPVGTRILVLSFDGTASVRDSMKGVEVARVGNYDIHNPAIGAAWSPAAAADGNAPVIIASRDGAARILRVFYSTQDLVDAAKARLQRCLTPEQRKTYFLPPAPPAWCIERRLWPYHTDDWQAWLAARKAGRAAPLPVPTAR